MTHYAFSHTAEKDVSQSGATVRAHNKKIYVVFLLHCPGVVLGDELAKLSFALSDERAFYFWDIEPARRFCV